MNTSFIEKVSSFLPSDNSLLSKTCVIFPTKRACIYFKNAMLQKGDNDSIWLPEILSLQEFLYREVPVDVIAEEDLLACLFKIHNHVTGKEQPVSTFYKWGQMILKDFNDVDQYLIDPDYLFNYVDAFKKIENDSKLNPEQVKWLSQFWNTIPDNDTSGVRSDFLKTWKHLGMIYQAFNDQLKTNGTAYEGMAYRLLLEELESGSKRFGQKEFHLVGFNALSAFEERLFKHLTIQYNAKLYWDADAAMLEDKQQEAGMFIRRYLKLFDESSNVLVSSDPDAAVKRIKVINAGMDSDQCRVALDLSAEWGQEQTVVVLCDESLVVPMIFQMKETSNANITMGYPLTLSGYSSFIRRLCVFKKGIMSGGRPNSILLLSILKFPHIRRELKSPGLKAFEEAVSKRGYLGETEIRSYFPPEDPLINSLLSVDSVAGYISRVLNLFHEFPGNESSEKIILEACMQAVQDLANWLSQHQFNTEVDEFSRLLQIRLSTEKIPFGSKQNEALQIMGFLETRNLDFRNVIILGANDEYLPGTSKSSSFIPYTIRRGLGMPTYHENDAIYGYHLFRLLQRAEHIAFVYTRQSAGKKLSRSRFVEQIIYEWDANPKIEITEHQVNVPVPKSQASELVEISKMSREVQQGLEVFLKGERQLSASAINTYIRCPFQFYLKYIAGLEEIEELSADLDQRDLGKIFHKAMELFYKPFLDSGQLINNEVLTAYKKATSLEQLVRKAFEEENYKFPKSGIKGKNLLVKQMIIAMMEAIIDCDIKSEPFRIAGLELKLDNVPFILAGGKKVLLKGYLDRVDKVVSEDGDFIRIIDYKTGNANFVSRRSKSAGEYFPRYFADPVYKEGLQAYLYSWMYNKVSPGSKIRTGFYTARQLSKGLKLLQEGNPIAPEDYSVFEDNLRALLEEMFDLSSPFIQSDDDKAYQYSSFDVLVG